MGGGPALGAAMGSSKVADGETADGETADGRWRDRHHASSAICSLLSAIRNVKGAGPGGPAPLLTPNSWTYRSSRSYPSAISRARIESNSASVVSATLSHE